MDLSTLPKPFFALAPMDDVTDTVFRRIVASCAPPDLCFTEFVNVDGLQSPGRPRLLPRLQFTDQEVPLIAQIWGKEPENFYRTARELADGTFACELGVPQGTNFAGIDINMGCPDKTVVKNGTCSALINNRSLAKEIIQATQEGADNKLPVSVKTRLGFNTVDLTWHEWLLGQNVAMLTVHGRTRKEMSKVPADWEKIGQIRELRDQIASQTYIVGNGDVSNRRHGLELAMTYKLDGIMIGRGIFDDPFAFSVSSSWASYTKEARKTVFMDHIKLFATTWTNNERHLALLNKFCKIYINGFEGAKELREQLMACNSTDELISTLTKS